MSKYCFGVDIGGTTVKIGLFSDNGSLVEKWEIATNKDNSGNQILPDIANAIKDKLDEKNISITDIIGVGMGVPGPVMNDGTVNRCVNLGWGVFHVAEEFTKLTGIENVKVANDANVAALGEMWKGGGQGFDNFVMLTLGTGVGGGIIIDGQILTGSKGTAGELGHIKVKDDELDTCGCGGKGCLEQYASATGVVRAANILLAQTKMPSKIRDVNHLSAKMVFDAAKENDELSMMVVEQLGKYLGTACGNIACTVDPEAFVIGGGVSRAGQILIDVIKKNYESRVMPALSNREFRLAELGNDAGIYGCAKLVL